ncbi:MAG: hypothetical protein ACTIJ9_08460 [Aequorivita sp.]
MKIAKMLFLFILTVATVSCSKDDDNNAEPPYSLTRTNFVDTYSMKSLEKKVVETITFNNGTTSTSTTAIVGSIFQNVNYSFNSNETFTATGLYTTIETTTNPDGTTEVSDPIIVNLDKTGTYSINPTTKVVTLTDQDNVQTSFEITQYSETEMKLHSETEATSGNSTTVTTSDMSFTR